jgi:hypothetical protein
VTARHWRQAYRLLVTQHISKAICRHCLGSSLPGAYSVSLLELRLYASCHVLSACRCVFSRDEYDKTGRAVRHRWVWKQLQRLDWTRKTPGKHKLHTTSCMHLWLACLGTRRTETDLLRRLPRRLGHSVCCCPRCCGVSRTSRLGRKTRLCLDNDRYVSYSHATREGIKLVEAR